MNQQTKVIVVADELGQVIGISPNNEEYGFVKVEQNVAEINNQGFLHLRTRSALIKGKLTDLQSLNFQAGQELPGKIVIRETLTQLDPKNALRGVKMAGETGIPCTVDDSPIYRETLYTLNEDLQDTLIQHDEACKATIREKQAELKLQMTSTTTQSSLV